MTIVRRTLFLATTVCLAFQPTLKGEEPSNPRVVELAKELYDKGWIAYGARSAAGDWDIFLMRPDGSASHNITNTPETNELAPRFSPNGKKMLYRRLTKTTQISHDGWGSKGQLVMADSDGTCRGFRIQDGIFRRIRPQVTSVHRRPAAGTRQSVHPHNDVPFPSRFRETTAADRRRPCRLATTAR
jgi:hypothetical protein